MARLYTGRPKVLAASRSYHGSTHASIHLTGDPRRWASDTGTAGAVHFFGPFLEMRGRPLTLFLGGSRPETPGYLRGVRDLCTRHGIVYIADEGLVGFGRTGAWFGVDHDGVAPRSAGLREGRQLWVRAARRRGGRRPDLRGIHETPVPAGMTYCGHPLACAAAVGAIRAMHDEGTVVAAARLGADVLGPGLTKLAEKHRSIGDIRGIGGLWTVELEAEHPERWGPCPRSRTCSPSWNRSSAISRDLLRGAGRFTRAWSNSRMQFDRHTLVLLVRRPDAPELTDEEAAELQDRHLAFRADLRDRGYLVGGGPLVDQDDERLRGISIMTCDPETARRLSNEDPAVHAGRLAVEVMTWMVPAGNVRFENVPAPRSMAEAAGD
jgi:uncharacterized protein YciI